MHWDAVAQRGNTLVFLMTTRQLRANMEQLLAHGVAPDTPAAVIRWGTVADRKRSSAPSRRSPTALPSGACSRLPLPSSASGRGAARAAALVRAQAAVRPPHRGDAAARTGGRVRRRARRRGRRRHPVPDDRDRAARVVGGARDGDRAQSSRTTGSCSPASTAWPCSSIACTRSAATCARCTAPGSPRSGPRPLRRWRRAGCWSTSSRRSSAPKASPRPCAPPALPGRASCCRAPPGRARSCRCCCARPGRRSRRWRAIERRRRVPTCARCANCSPPGAIDLLTFTSSSTVRHFLALLGDGGRELLRDVAIGCIGPITAATAREAGLRVAVQPRAYTVAAFTEAILRYFAGETHGTQ